MIWMADSKENYEWDLGNERVKSSEIISITWYCNLSGLWRFYGMKYLKWKEPSEIRKISNLKVCQFAWKMLVQLEKYVCWRGKFANLVYLLKFRVTFEYFFVMSEASKLGDCRSPFCLVLQQLWIVFQVYSRWSPWSDPALPDRTPWPK